MSHKSKKAITPKEQYQMDLQLESDLGRLVKQEKYFERERGTYTSGAKMAKQIKLINILEKEQSNVLMDLGVATCSTKKKEDAKITSDMITLLHENNLFDGRIKETKANLQEIEDQIVMVKKNVIAARSKVIGDSQYEAKVLAGQKTVECLENKLDTAAKRFCVTQTANSKLRDEIEHLLQERVNFNKLWEKLILNLDNGKKFMIDIIEQSTIAYNERDEWVTKLQALRSRAHNDLVLHSEEMLGLQRHSDDYTKLQKFLSIKGQKRFMRDLQRKEMDKMVERRKAMENRLSALKELLAEILEFSHITTIQEFCSVYVQQEEDNFGMFNYITVLRQEMESLTEALVILHRDMDAQKDIHNKRAQHQIDNIAKLKEELEKVTQEADTSQAELNKTNADLAKIYLGIDKLFRSVKCSYAPILELLGNATTITDYNAGLYLNLLENRISELIMDVYSNQKSRTKDRKLQTLIIYEDDVARPLHLIHNVVPTNPCPLCVDQEMVSDVIDTLQFVQNRDEVTDKLERRLALPDGLDRLHNVSACHLPKSRQIMQRRYQ